MQRDETIDGIIGALQRIGRALEQPGRASGFAPAQAAALRFIATTRPDMTTIGHLARVLGVRHPTAVGIVRPLIEQGLVRRSVHPYDGRSRTLELTEKGKEALVGIEAVTEALRAHFRSLSEQELRAAEDGLRAIVATLQQARVIVVSAPCAGCAHFRPDTTGDAHRPHHCALIERDLTDGESRMLCPEHTPRGRENIRHNSSPRYADHP